MPNTGEPQGQEPTDSTATTATTTETKDPWDGIPEEWAWTKGEVESARSEAAGRRVALREAEEKLKSAKSPEEFTAAMAEFQKKETDLTANLARERAARKHGLSDDVLEFLTGTDEAQIEKQAAKLAALKPTKEPVVTKVITQTAPAGGSQPTADTTAPSGREAWKAYKASR